MLLPFGPWTPDQPELASSTLVAKNVVPATLDARTGAASYRKFLAFANTITALAARVQGAIAVKATEGGTYIYAGTAATLQELGPGASSFTDRSKSGGYSCAADQIWSRARYGSSVYFANIADAIQVATIGGGSAFADLSTAAPKCRHLGVFGLFLMAANTWDSTDGFRGNRIWWPAIDNPASWPTVGSAAAAAVQSDYQDLPDGGAITGLVGGETGGYVVCESKIFRAVYPSSAIFDFLPVEEHRGSRFPGSVIGVGRYVFFLGDDGFWMFNGVESIPIGTQKVDREFLADLDAIHIPRICAAIDPINKFVMWAYPGSGNSLGNPSKIIIFNWAIGCWSYVEATLEYLISGLSLGYTLEGLDALSFTLDTLPYSLDSYVWQGGVPLLVGFDTSHRMGAFTGSALQATLTTGERQLIEGRRAFVPGVSPLVTSVGTNITVTPITRNRLMDATSTGTAVSINAAGVCPLTSEARYHRFQIDVTGGFTHAIGAEVEASDAGAY